MTCYHVIYLNDEQKWYTYISTYIYIYIYPQNPCLAVAKIVIRPVRIFLLVQAKCVFYFIFNFNKMHFDLRPPMNLSTSILRGRCSVLCYALGFLLFMFTRQWCYALDFLRFYVKTSVMLCSWLSLSCPWSLSFVVLSLARHRFCGCRNT